MTSLHLTTEILLKFNNNLNRATACFEWLGCKQPNGYGVFRPGRASVGTDLAHRFAWIVSNGPIPDGLNVLHTCDNRACCNIEHLFLGTQQDNISDKVAKGRAHSGITCGELHWKCKLTDAQVDQIIQDQRSCKVIAEELGMKRTQIWRIKTGRARSKPTGIYKLEQNNVIKEETC